MQNTVVDLYQMLEYTSSTQVELKLNEAEVITPTTDEELKE